ncbi:MAG: hypothetical protein M1826_003427 [Phylliscum demangeonii]|nr:MAG: hypothetical protein M1826_003427 [Phylliscum demangeonii]
MSGAKPITIGWARALAVAAYEAAQEAAEEGNPAPTFRAVKAKISGQQLRRLADDEDDWDGESEQAEHIQMEGAQPLAINWIRALAKAAKAAVKEAAEAGNTAPTFADVDVQVTGHLLKVLAADEVDWRRVLEREDAEELEGSGGSAGRPRFVLWRKKMRALQRRAGRVEDVDEGRGEEEVESERLTTKKMKTKMKTKTKKKTKKKTTKKTRKGANAAAAEEEEEDDDDAGGEGEEMS